MQNVSIIEKAIKILKQHTEAEIFVLQLPPLLKENPNNMKIPVFNAGLQTIAAETKSNFIGYNINPETNMKHDGFHITDDFAIELGEKVSKSLQGEKQNFRLQRKHQ